MKQIAREGIQVFRRSFEFLASSAVTSAHGPITTHANELKSIGEKLNAFGIEQDESTRAHQGLTSSAHAQAETLRVELMRPISHMAQRLFPHEPQLLRALTMPRGRDYERILAAGNAFIAVAEAHKATFTGAGFAADFLDRLKAATDALRATLDARNEQLGRRSAATAGVNQELQRGRALLRMLNDMVGPPLKADHALFAKWRTLSRFERSGRQKGATTPPTDGEPAAPVPPTPAPAPAGNGVTHLPAPPQAGEEVLPKAA